MPGYDWNGNGKKDTFDHFMDMKVTEETNDKLKNISSENSNKSSKSFGLGWVVIVIVAIMLIFFIADGTSWDAIDTLLGLGFLAFLFFRWIST